MTKLKPFKEIEKILFYEDEIKNKIKNFAPQINEYYKNKDNPIIVGVLRGCAIFQANLMANLDFDATYEFCSVNRSKGTKLIDNKFNLTWITHGDMKNKNVLIVEDVIDSGITLEKLKKHLLEERQAKEVKTITLIDKPLGRKVEFEPDWKLITLKTKAWVTGWGFDIDGLNRNLPYIATVKGTGK